MNLRSMLNARGAAVALSLQNESEDPKKIVRILHLEDNRSDRELAKCLLEEAGINCEINTVETRADFVHCLQNGSWDLILSDFALPAFDGSEALSMAVQSCPNTPFIFLSGTMSEDRAVESLKSGATDYVLKQSMARLPASVERALEERNEKLRRLQAEEELKRSEEQLRFMAYHDALTGLPNRALFQDRLESMLAGARRHQEKVALVFLDLDRFKNINDSFGHTAGDSILKQVGERLRKCVRDIDTVARLGGDEFVVIVGSVRDSTDAVIAADRIRRTIAIEFEVHGIFLSTTCSIGISVFPEDGEDGETLLKNADVALFSAKDNGRNRWKFFTPDMDGRALERLTLENSLRRALERDEFFLEYQPQVDISTGRIVGAEALLRWRHPELGLIPPNTFIPVAENTGDIIRIGEWVIRNACAQAMEWQHRGMPPLVMAVNVSAVQFRHEPWLRVIHNVLDQTGLQPQYLELEVTESLLLANADVLTSMLNQLGNLGLKLAIDDFGTGYCGLSYLRRFRFSRLKIDQSFVQTIAVDHRDAALAASIISIGKILQMKVIAECVETKEQLDILRSLGCDEIQGYYFSRPLSASAFSEMVQSNQASLAS